MNNAINITLNISEDSDYNELLQCAARLFKKNIESSECKIDAIRQKYKELESKFNEIKEWPTKINALLKKHGIGLGVEGELPEQMLSKLDSALAECELERTNAKGAYSRIMEVVGGESKEGKWEDLENIIREREKVFSDVQTRISSIIQANGIVTKGDEVQSITDWINQKNELEREGSDAKREIISILGKEEMSKWTEIVQEVRESCESGNKYKEQCFDKDKLVSTWIHDRMNRIGDLIKQEINGCENNAMKEYMNDFLIENNGRQKDNKDIVKIRELDSLTPIVNLIWWSEQEKLNPFLKWCQSISQISKLLDEICQYSELLGYKISIPKGIMSKEKLPGYSDEATEANPERYYKIFSEVSYPEQDCFCMIDKLAIVDNNSDGEKNEGKCYRSYR